jgi:hypothetical protein
MKAFESFPIGYFCEKKPPRLPKALRVPKKNLK